MPRNFLFLRPLLSVFLTYLALAAFPAVPAHAACTGYPAMANGDYVLSMAGTGTAMITSKSNAATAIGANGIAGMVAYDTTANALKVCDGANWTALGGGTLSGLSDVTITSIANNDMLRYETATSKWKNVSMNTALGTTTMVPSWPDAIECVTGSNRWMLFYNQKDTSTGDVYYRFSWNGNTTVYQLTYSSTGANSANLNMGGFDCVADTNYTSISKLYTQGRAFNFIGTSGLGPDQLDFTEFRDAMALDAPTDIAVDGSELLSITNTGTGDSLVVNDVASDTSSFKVEADGDVGINIGTVAGSVALDIRNGSNSSTVFQLAGASIATGQIITDASLDMTVKNVSNGKMFFGTNNLTRMTIDATGNVGVGTTNPGYGLQVEKTNSTGGNGWSALFRESSAYNGVIIGSRGTGAGVATIAGVLANLSAHSDLSLNPFGGNVGIGTASPAYRFHVQAAVDGGYVAAIENTINTSSNYPYGLLVRAGRNDGAGSYKVMIGFQRPDGTHIGDIYQNGASGVALATTSDRRLKENIKPIESGLDRVMRLEPVQFTFKSDLNDKPVEGFIAQDVFKVFPDAVSTNGDDGIVELDRKERPWGVDYGRLSPLLVKAIQDLKAENDTLRSQLKAANDNDVEHNAAIEELRREIETIKLGK